jgi:phosphatidylserine decarboxylase
MFAKEGLPFMVASVILFLLFFIGLFIPEFVFVLSVLVMAMIFWFFRDPHRTAPTDEYAFVTGADGKVVEISEKELHGIKYRKISVFMNVFSVHVNRAPYSGVVKKVQHIPGSFLNAADERASAENERNEIFIDTPHGGMVVVQVAGLVARRTVSYVEKGTIVSKAERIGMIKFSSRVDHYLPLDVTVEVELGDKVRAGESIIARA